MIQITADQIERVNLILSGVPKGAEKAMASVIRRANNTVRSEALKGITSVYAITRQNVRADTTIKVRTQKADGGVVGMVSFAGYKIPLYRFNVSPTLPVQRATVSAAVLAESGRTPCTRIYRKNEKRSYGHVRAGRNGQTSDHRVHGTIRRTDGGEQRGCGAGGGKGAGSHK